MFSGSLDVCESLFALVVGDVLYLIEAGNGVSNVRRVVQWLFALIGKGVDGGWQFFALLCVESLVVFVVLPGCFHLSSFNSLALERVITRSWMSHRRWALRTEKRFCGIRDMLLTR